MRERDIIRRHFNYPGGEGALIGVGDDGAVLSPPPGARLALSVDALAVGTHFFPDDDPYYLARKAAAVSLSDIAAMGAKPLWLAATIASPPAPDEWFAEFARGLSSSAAQHHFAVVGGDLARAQTLSITTTLIGACLAAPLTRAGVAAGDDLWVSGALGGAAHALAARLRRLPPAADMAQADAALRDPQPRLPLAAALAGLAGAATDLSDGLLTSARALAEASGVGLRLRLPALPAAASLSALPADARRECLLRGGDDYELLFAAPPALRERVAALATSDVPLSRIGEAVAGGGVFVDGEEIPPEADGYEHDFAV